MHRHSLTYRGAMLNINRYRLRASSCPDIYRNSMTTIAKEKTQWGQGLDEFKSVLMDMLDFSFFIDIRFTLFAISNFLLYAWYDVPYMYLADYSKELGFSKKDGSSFISYIGLINMLGEIMLGWFGDRKFITAGMIYAICMVFCGLVTGLVPLFTSYTVCISETYSLPFNCRIEYILTIHLFSTSYSGTIGIVRLFWIVYCSKLCAHQYYFSGANIVGTFHERLWFIVTCTRDCEFNWTTVSWMDYRFDGQLHIIILSIWSVYCCIGCYDDVVASTWTHS